MNSLNQYLKSRQFGRGSAGSFQFRYRFWTVVKDLEKGGMEGGYAKAITLFRYVRSVARIIVKKEKAGESIVPYCHFLGISKPEIIRWLKMAAMRVERSKMKDRDYFTLLDQQAAEMHRQRAAMDAEDVGDAREAGRLRFEPTKQTSQDGVIVHKVRSDKGKKRGKRKA